MKKTYLKSTFRDIRFSLGRFIAIILIIFMGTLLFVGIKSVGPDLTNSAQKAFEKSNMSDVQVISTAGLTQADKKAVEKVPDTEAQLSKGFASVEQKNQNNLQVYSYSKKDKQNKLTIIKGHLPKKADQIVVDRKISGDYPLDSTMTLKNDSLKHSKYQVVGYVDSPLYISNNERGNSSVGDGQVDGFVYLPEQNFATDVYSQMYLSFNNLKNKNYSTSSYKKGVSHKVSQVNKELAARKGERQTELQKVADQKTAPARQKLTDQQNRLNQSKQQLQQGQQQLQVQEQQLQQQQAQLASQVGEQQAKQQLSSANQRLNQQKQQLNQQNQRLNDAQGQITQGQKELQDRSKVAKPTYMENRRTDMPGFTDYASLSDRIDAIANIFPVFFFFIAILITFTTMTRMITENRREIGTLLSLGYKKTEISVKYIVYSILTALIGSALGIVLGTKTLPPIVFKLLGSMYIFTDYISNYYAYLIWIAIAAALVATLGSALLVLLRDLREKPVDLLVEKAPKAGKRILLEHITPIWRRLGFTQKMTARNLFRYKSRMILTIVGIAGCTGLMLAGFGLNDSIPAPGAKQYSNINRYQALVTLKDNLNSKNKQKVAHVLNKNSQVTEKLLVHSEQVTFRQNGSSNQDATLYAVKQREKLKEYISLTEPHNKNSQVIPKSGAMVSQRLAQDYDLHKGDKLHFEDDQGNDYTIKLASITENYVGHNVYLSSDYYNKVAGEQPDNNTYLVHTKKLNQQKEESLADDLADSNGVLNTSYTNTLESKLEKSVSGMSSIVFIFIILSGTLAFVVLYNLTNINISERRRELATFKVLGFFDKEVTMVIVRENIIFTLFGILFGFGVGWLLNWFILTYASSNMMVFPVVIHWPGYLVSALMTIAFSTVVMFVTHRKLKNVDMIGALNSSE